MKQLRILRGLPGSGKTTLARQLGEQGAAVFSTDDHLVKGGNFRWTEEGSLEAHHTNQRLVIQAMRSGHPHIVVDNCHIRAYAVAPYVRLAKFYKYSWTIRDVDTEWSLDIQELAKRNAHNVPESVIEVMAKAYIAMPTEAMLTTLQWEQAMDPEGVLREAQEALEKGDHFKVDECIIDYQDWRKMGGFEPVGGDETADNISQKLDPWRQDMWTMGW